MTDPSKSLRCYPTLEGQTFLICLGAAKCGTSWLHHYLGTLPQVAESPLKELHFFNSKFPVNALGDMQALALKRLGFHLAQAGEAVSNLQQRNSFQASVDRAQMIYDDNAYFGHFARLSRKETRAFCDLTPAYSVIGHNGFAFIKQFCAVQRCKVRILFLMRDPITRYWSQIRHLQQMKPDSDVTSKWQPALSSAALRARADYQGIVAGLEKVFPAEDILYLFYETLFSPDSLQKLCDFIDVPFAPAEGLEARNVTKVTTPLPHDARAALRNLLAPQYIFCRERFGTSLPSDWQSDSVSL